MSWSLKKRKQREHDVQIDQVREKVEDLEGRVNSITEILIEKIPDPWAQGILRQIHEK